MESAHLFKHRKYLGLYNAPGSYAVAKRYAKLVNSRLLDGPYPRVKEEPATLLKMDGQQGPRYIGTVSGRQVPDTGHIGYLLAQMCRHDLAAVGTVGRVSVTIIQLGEDRFHDPQSDKIKIATSPFPFLSAPLRHIMSIATMLLNIGACLVCGIFREWYAFALIMVGILCNGFACFKIGSTKIFLELPSSSPSGQSGHGVINDRDQIIVLRGTQAVVNNIIYGKFVVEYGQNGDNRQQTLGATALVIQFITQLPSLFLIPQSGLFGQILFISTLLVSWINNACLATIDREALQMKIVTDYFPFQKPLGIFQQGLLVLFLPCCKHFL